jgi:hypothetical protein
MSNPSKLQHLQRKHPKPVPMKLSISASILGLLAVLGHAAPTNGTQCVGADGTSGVCFLVAPLELPELACPSNSQADLKASCPNNSVFAIFLTLCTDNAR